MKASEGETLRVLQQWFAETTTSVMFDYSLDQSRRSLQPSVQRRIRSTRNRPAMAGLAIYNRGYFSRLAECLADDYPAMRACMGEAAFDALVRDYAQEYPSRCAYLNRFGQFVPEFIAARDVENKRFLCELSRFEWALVECIHADAPTGTMLDDLRVITPERLARLQFRPSPSLRLLEFEYPINQYVRACLEGTRGSVPPIQTTRVAMARCGTQVWRIDLARGAFELLSRLTRGQTLEDALCGIGISTDDLREYFATWAECGCFVGVAEER